MGNLNTLQISVLVPVYNVVDYLRDCLDSILNQTYRDFEIVTVDDGSTDSSLTILTEYAAQDSRIKVITHQKNEGLAETRNTALRHAAGRFVAFVDSDDFIAPSYLEDLVQCQERTNADIVSCGRIIYYNKKHYHNHARPKFANMKMDSETALRALLCYSSFDMSMWAKLFRKSLFDDIRFPYGVLSEDEYVCYRLIDKANIVYYLPRHLYYYRQRSGSISKNGKSVNTHPLIASSRQRDFIISHYPALKKQADTACFFDAVGVYNDHVFFNITPISENLLKLINAETTRDLKSVLSNKDIPMLKKAQAILFKSSKHIYDKMLRRKG